MPDTRLPRHYQRVLEEAEKAVVAGCPNGAVILARKIVEMHLGYKGFRKQVWEVVAYHALDDGEIDNYQLAVALHIRSAGNRAAHSHNGVVVTEGAKCVELAKLFLKLGGYTDPLLANALTLSQIVKVHGPLSHDLPWARAEPFDTNVTHWPEGGMVETLSKCEFCDGPVVSEDLVIPPVVLTADNSEESTTYDGTFGVCLVCEADYRVDSTNSFGGWSVEIRPDGDRKTNRRPGRRWARELPPPRTGSFRYKVIHDNEADVQP